MHSYGSHGIQPKRWFVEDAKKVVRIKGKPPKGASSFSKETKDWIWSKINRGSDSECWPCYTANNEFGYPRLRVFGALFKGHRLVYEMEFGEIPDGMLVCHKCDNPPCCNPNHMFIGSPKDNMSDASKKGRLATGDRHGSKPGRKKKENFKVDKHTRTTGEMASGSKFKDSTVLEVYEKYKRGGISQAQLAKDYNMSASHVWGIVNGVVELTKKLQFS